MPRRPRIVLPNIPVKLLQKTSNKQKCFRSDQDYRYYLQLLKQYTSESSCAIHAYALLPDHIHLLLTPTHVTSVASLMKNLGQNYTQYYNRTYQRKGSLWAGRFRSSVIDEDNFFFPCLIFIEMNPVFARLVKRPKDYQWSSYRINAYGEPDELVGRHRKYINLGNNQNDRQTAYRQLFRDKLPTETIKSIQRATGGNYVLGDENFAARISRITGLQVTPLKQGRPRKDKGSDI